MGNRKIISVLFLILLFNVCFLFDTNVGLSFFVDLEKEGEIREAKDIRLDENIRDFQLCDTTHSFSSQFLNTHFITDNISGLLRSSALFSCKLFNHSPPITS